MELAAASQGILQWSRGDEATETDARDRLAGLGEPSMEPWR